MTIAVAWSQALAWRLRRQFLDPVGAESVEGVIRRLGAVAAQSDDATELMIRARREHSQAGEVGLALTEGRLIKTFAFRGATHLLTPENAGHYLALRLAGRQWELPSWQSYYGLAPADWPAFREAVREALASGPLTVDELVRAIAATPGYRRLGSILEGNPWSVMKALTWHGDMSFGPPRGRATFQRLDGNPRWAGIPDLESAGMYAVEAYLRAYGPATLEQLQYWLGSGLSAGRKRIQGWFARLADRLVEVEVDGASAYVLRDDVEELVATPPSPAVVLLPAYDQWVLGPGTADAHVVPPAHRELVSRGANIVIVGGVVAGTWSLGDEEVGIDWFAESAAPPSVRLDDAIARIATLVGRPLRSSIGS